MTSVLTTSLTTADCPVQRWKLGRQFWRHDRDEGFRKAHYAVDAIEEAAARRFVVDHHYSHSHPYAVARIGLFKGLDLVGVSVFSVPVSQAAVPKYCGVAAAEGVELGRFVLLDQCEYNAESFFLARALALLPQLLPQARAVVAYSDPMPRHTAGGEVVLGGHCGIAYQALSSRYVGRAQPQPMYLNRDGLAVSTRGMSKIRRQEHGAASAEKRLVRLGAPPRRFGQDPSAWLQEALQCGAFRKLRHPGNHVYTFALGSARQKRRAVDGFAPALPYPKALDPAQHQLLAA